MRKVLLERKFRDKQTAKVNLLANCHFITTRMLHVRKIAFIGLVLAGAECFVLELFDMV